MTIFFQDKDTEDVLFGIEDATSVPNVGESVMIDTTWYIVTERTFYCNSRYSCTLWVMEDSNESEDNSRD